MQPFAINRRFVLSRFSLWLLACVVLFSGAGLAAARSSAAHAASTSTDPLVVVAVDQTGSGCVTHRFQSIGTTVISSSTTPCLPGTVMAALTIHRSQAMLEHQAFIVLPPSNATLAERQQFNTQVDLFVFKQRQLLRQHIRADITLEPNIALKPDSGCGYNAGISTGWVVDGDYIYSDLYYYENSDCTDANLQSTDIELDSSFNNPLWWRSLQDYDYFIGGPEEWYAGCPSVAPEYHYYSIGLGNENENNGNDIEQEFSTQAGCDYRVAQYYLNLGNL